MNEKKNKEEYAGVSNLLYWFQQYFGHLFLPSKKQVGDHIEIELAIWKN